MKKIVIILMFLAAQVACAQNGWKKISYSDGNLAGNHTEAYEYKIDGVGRFVFWDSEDGDFQLFCDSTTFLTKSFDTIKKTYTGNVIIVQTFRKSGMPVSKYKVWLDKRLDTTGNCLQTESHLNRGKNLNFEQEDYSWKEKMRRMFYYINNDKGYVIIQAPLSGDRIFSLKITPLDIK